MKDAKILVASDITSDADLVRKLLREEYEQVFVSTVADQAAADFERRKPEVLILAFNGLDKAEHYYLGLYRLSALVHTLPHRTLILCNKDDLQQVYALCKKDYFDDYILFWPLIHDALRLPMAVRHALRDLESTRGDAPTSAEMAGAARRIAELEGLLERGLAQAGEQADTANRSLHQVEKEIDAAIDGFSEKLMTGELAAAVHVRDAARLQQEIGRMKTEDVGQHLRTLNDAVRPMGQWVGELQQAVRPYLESAQALQLLADRVRPVVLVVDDDEFQHKLIGSILEAQNYELVYAASSAEVLRILRNKQPELILLDLIMPEIDGLETLRRIKSAEQLSHIPVMMLTGQSAKSVVLEALKAGAADFMVKPVDREILLKKVAKILLG